MQKVEKLSGRKLITFEIKGTSKDGMMDCLDVLNYEDSRSSIKAYDIESEINNDQEDLILENANKAASATNIVITCAGVVFEKVGFFASGISIIEQLNKMHGPNVMKPSGTKYALVEAQADNTLTIYTYVKLKDGNGDRLGLTTQKLTGVDINLETKALNQETRTYEVDKFNVIENKNFTSEGYYNRNSIIIRNAQLNENENQKFVFTVKGADFSF